MRRAGFLLLLLLISPARADVPAPVAGFASPLAADVFSTALAFMEPRILDPVPIPTLAVWGLHGLTAIDPQLTPELHDNTLRLLAPARILFTAPAPKADDPLGWGRVIAAIAAAGYATSPALQHAGTPGIIRSFFDELFNHLDPYSRYTPPLDAQNDRLRRSGSAGVGVTLGMRGRAIILLSVIRDGPADMAGLRPGQQLVAVDGQNVTGRRLADVMQLLAGPEGTRVRLTVHGRPGTDGNIELERAMVPPETVFPERAGDMLILHVTSFDRSTGEHFAQAIISGLAPVPKAKPVAGIVIDLRGNRGGLLRQAVAAASTLLGPGPVATTAGRDPQAAHNFVSQGQDLASGLPVVVVVDGRSASASEILAAALSDRGRAVVVGSSTLGKGLVQTITDLPDGGELFVTWSRVLAPRGWPLQGLGVLPQVCTSLGEAVLERELAALAEGVAPMAAAVARSRAARAPMPVNEILDIRNACPAAEGRETDLRTAGYLIDNPAAYAAALLPPMRPGVPGALPAPVPLAGGTHP